ncbi:MAG TPA: hypothetical protein VKT33_15325 [Candidatus Angelobacter sp.]|nr:hypothetical protein [Candidatus Angelobacter sp.]
MISSLRGFFCKIALIICVHGIMVAQIPTTITGITITPTDVVGSSTTVLHGTVTVQRGSDIFGRPFIGAVGYEMSIVGSNFVSFHRFSCDFQVPALGGGSVCAVPDDSNTGSFTLVPDGSPTDVNLSVQIHLGDGSQNLQPGQIALTPVTIRAQRASVKFVPDTIPDGVPTQVTAIATFMTPPEPNIHESNLPAASVDPVFGNLNAVSELQLEMLGNPLFVKLPSDFIPLIPPFAFFEGPAGPNQFSKTFTITATHVTEVPFRVALPLIGHCGCVINGDGVLKVGETEKFQLSLGKDGGGNALVHVFDASTTSIDTPFQVKLGQQFPVEIAPVNPDGTVGSPLVVTEEIDNAKPGDILQGSSIPGTVVTLFKNKVLLHFAQSSNQPHHDFFPIHSGTAALKLTFTSNGTQHNLTFPVSVTSCVANGDCDPLLGKSNSQFDGFIMAFADRGGIPPQVIKAQVAQESGFNAKAFRYEPLSLDFKFYNISGALTVPPPLQPWTLAQSRNCTSDPAIAGNVPAGDNIELSSADVTPRQKIYGVFVDDKEIPLCRVPAIPQSPVVSAISSEDALLSMENILYTNDACFFQSICSGWATINAGSFDTFTDFQVEHPPFTGQTVVASSYGLHQLLYPTAVIDMGFADGGIGLPPQQLFDPFVSLDLGSRYLATQYTKNNLSQNADFPDLNTFLFQFGPALRGYNGPPRRDFNSIFNACGATPYIADSAHPSPLDYPCLILQASPKFKPLPLEVK